MAITAYGHNYFLLRPPHPRPQHPPPPAQDKSRPFHLPLLAYMWHPHACSPPEPCRKITCMCPHMPAPCRPTACAPHAPSLSCSGISFRPSQMPSPHCTQLSQSRSTGPQAFQSQPSLASIDLYAPAILRAGGQELQVDLSATRSPVPDQSI